MFCQYFVHIIYAFLRPRPLLVHGASRCVDHSNRLPRGGLPAGSGADGRDTGVALHWFEHHLNRHSVPDWVPVPSVASGTPAGVSASLPQEADAAASRVDAASITVDQEAFESEFGWLAIGVSVV
jgi:hypothetical protein